MKKIALIAHDKKKADLIEFVKENKEFFKKQDLISTGTTGLRIMEEVDLEITRFQSGPIGGDQQVGALVATNEVEAIFFFRDPLTSQPHEPDVQALGRLCDVHGVAIATNIATAKLMIKNL